MQIYCHHCKAEIPAHQIDFERRIATCAECGTLVVIADQLVQPEPAWPELLLPKGVSVVHHEGELRLNQRWFNSTYLGVAFFCLVWNGALLWGALNTGIWLYLFTPHGWIGMGCLYYVLAGFLNTMVIRVNRDQLSIRHRPIPSFGNKTLPVQTIDQIYAKERQHKNKSRLRYSYEVHMIDRVGKDKTLVKGLEEPLQALYLEEELEHFLGIEDRKIQGELGSFQGAVNWNSWQNVAKADQLTFTESKLLEGTRISGSYRGYDLGLIVIRKGPQRSNQFYTRLVLSRPAGLPVVSTLSSTLPKIATFFNEIQTKLSKVETFELAENGRKLIYEQPDILLKAARLQALFDLTTDLMETYAQLVALGAEAIPALQPVVADKSHRLRPVASQIIQDIGAATLGLKPQLPTLLCRRCLARCTTHEIETSWLTAMAYYGCRLCHQSRDFLTADQVIAVLDSQMDQGVSLQGQTVRVNWLKRRSLFDFDRVEIIRATDEDAERFAVQVGNDTDPYRRERSHPLSCRVAPESGLSDNSLRILKQTFGELAP